MRNERMTMAEAMEKTGQIIRLQSEVIDELFLIALQHITAEEAAALPCMSRAKEAALLREEIEREEGSP